MDALTLDDLSELYSIDDGKGKAHEEKRTIADHRKKLGGKR